jgi:bifunctional DNA-binding transcriptional regulator/antitoxin component of YhaV-PrlF toxin-antitoxin module
MNRLAQEQVMKLLRADSETYTLAVNAQGQMTLPVELCRHLDLYDGDVLQLVRLGDVVLLAPKSYQVAELTEQFSTLMKEAGVTLDELLQGLQDERVKIWEERYAKCVESLSTTA